MIHAPTPGQHHPRGTLVGVGEGFDEMKQNREWDDYDDHDAECANCGGEGFTYGCSWDWQCSTYDEGDGTCLCTRRCEWCQPLTATEIAAQQQLRDALATALAKDKVAEMRARKEVP